MRVDIPNPGNGDPKVKYLATGDEYVLGACKTHAIYGVWKRSTPAAGPCQTWPFAIGKRAAGQRFANLESSVTAIDPPIVGRWSNIPTSLLRPDHPAATTYRRKRVRRVIRLHPIRTAVAALLLVGIATGTVVVLTKQDPQSTVSYKDGYAVGLQAGSSGLGALGAGKAGGQATCEFGLTSPPNGDNPNLWQRGCLAGYNAALAQQGDSMR
jgi:hypothetical protein